MTTPPTNPLQQAAAHLRAGKRAEARGILALYVRQNPNSENGWLMLSLALEEPKQQIDCLNIVLRINPNNAEARERLSQLAQNAPTAILDPAQAPDLDPAPPAPAPPPQAPAPAPTPAWSAPPPVPDSDADGSEFSLLPEAASAPEVEAASEPLDSPTVFESAEVASNDPASAPPDSGTGPLPPVDALPDAPESAGVETSHLEPLPAEAGPAPDASASGPGAKPFYTGPLQEMLAEEEAPGQEQGPPAGPIMPQMASIGESDDTPTAEFTQLIVAREPITPTPTPAAAPRRTPRLSCILIAVFSLILVAILAVVGVNAYLTVTRSPTPPPAVSATRPATLDLTGLAFPTFPPSHTPSATATITLTPTITPTVTETLIPTPQQPDEEALAQMQAIELQVAELRGLNPAEGVQRNIVETRNVAATLQDLYFREGGTREALDSQARVMEILGLVRPDFDMLSFALASAGNSPDAFYVPQTKQIYMVGTGFGAASQWIYAYEYNHALVDAAFDVAGMDVMPVCQGDRQRCDAVRALIGGDSMLAMAQWFEQNGSPGGAAAFNNYDMSEPVVTLLAAPIYVQRQLAFPYVEGKQFVDSLFGAGGWEQVDGAYAALPQTTEHILHPDRYLEGEPAVQVEAPALESVLSGDWQRIASDSLGEWTTFLTLRAGLMPTARLPEQVSLQAADGWGGDVYQAFYNSTTDQTILVVHWAWDSPEDADEFASALFTNQDERFDSAKVARTDGDCWENNGLSSCIFASTEETLWILAPDQPTINNILSRFPAFQ